MGNEIPGGYNGKILRVNLSNKTTKTENLEAGFCRKYLGGAGFIAYYLFKELKPGIDALSSDNKLIFALGPVTGLVLPGSARNCIGAKSPLTGGIAKAEVGGFWMAELKRSGYDAIIIEGKSDKPVFLFINDGEVSIKDASKLWGKETLETETAIRTELHDENIQVAMIGPAGENLVRYACIMEGCYDAAGRAGLGAVMGSKNLKAVAVRGHTLPPVANLDKVKEIRQQLTHPNPLSEFGTTSPFMLVQEATGDLPIRNFQDGSFPAVSQMHAGAFKEIVNLSMDGCFACPIRCKKRINFDKPYKVNSAYGGPEYETMAALGSDCGVIDVKAVIKGNERCNAYSLDSISTGSTIAFAMECYEKGFITKEDTGGLELKWGDAEVMLKVIELITKREGIGNLLAEGTARLSRKIGKGSEAFAMHVKGLEPGMHEPRIAAGLALSFMLSPIGADHCTTDPDGMLSNEMMFAQYHPLGWLNPPDPIDLSPYKVAIFRDAQFQHVLYDSLVVCQFPGLNFEQTVELLKGVTGWDTGLPEIMRIAERIVTLMRLFNLREGISSKDDKLPERFYQSTRDGALKNYTAEKSLYGGALKYYYNLLGWDNDGVPYTEKLEELMIK